MTILLVLLLIAEIPTAFFNWNTYDHSGNNDPREVSAANATSYARCFFDMQIASERFDVAARALSGCHSRCSDHTPSLRDTAAFQNMIITFLLLVFNFFTRITKIMDGPSTWVTYNLRIPLSRWWRTKVLLADSAFLRSPRIWTPRYILIRKYFVVKQGLALLLLSRLYADLYTSMLSEVSTHPIPTAVITVYLLSYIIRYTGF